MVLLRWGVGAVGVWRWQHTGQRGRRSMLSVLCMGGGACQVGVRMQGQGSVAGERGVGVGRRLYERRRAGN
jgi:hypothetical protein